MYHRDDMGAERTKLVLMVEHAENATVTQACSCKTSGAFSPMATMLQLGLKRWGVTLASKA
jgi:hypothetical protein